MSCLVEETGYSLLAAVLYVHQLTDWSLSGIWHKLAILPLVPKWGLTTDGLAELGSDWN